MSSCSTSQSTRTYLWASPQPVWLVCLPDSGAHLQLEDDQCYVLVCDPSALPRRDYTKASPQPVWLVFLLASGLRLQSGDDQYYVLVCDPSAFTKKRLHQGLTPTSMACVSPGFRTPSSIGRWSILCSGLWSQCTYQEETTRRPHPNQYGLSVSWIQDSIFNWKMINIAFWLWSQCTYQEGLWSQCFFQEETTPRPHPNQYGLCVSRLQDSVFNREMINVMFWKIWDPSAFIKKRLHQGLTPTSVACVSPIFRTLSSIGKWSMLCSRRFGIPTASTKKRLPEGLTPTSMACVSPGFRTPSSIGRWSILHSGCDPSALTKKVCDPSASTKKRLPQGLTPTSMACVSPDFRTLSSIGRWSMLCSGRFGIPVLLSRRDYTKASPQSVWLVCPPYSGLCLQSGDDQCYIQEDLGAHHTYQEETTRRSHPNQCGLHVSRLQDSIFNREMINVMFWFVIPVLWPRRDYIKASPQPVWLACLPDSGLCLQSGDDQCYVQEGLGSQLLLPRRDYPKASPHPVWLVCLLVSGLHLQLEDDQYCILVVIPVHLLRRDYPKASPQPVWPVCLPDSGLHLQSGDDQCYVQEDLGAHHSHTYQEETTQRPHPNQYGLCVSRLQDSIFNWKMINIAFWMWSQCFYQEETTPRPHPNQYGLCFSWLQDSVFNREMINIMFWFVIPVLLPRRDYPKASPQPVWPVCLLDSGLHLQLEDDQYCILVVIPVHLPRRFVIPVLWPRRDYTKASPQPVWLACLPDSVSPRFRTLSSIGRWSMLCSRRFVIPPQGLTPTSAPDYRTLSSPRRDYPRPHPNQYGLCVSHGFRTLSSIGKWSMLCSRRFVIPTASYQEETTRRPHPNQYGLCVSWIQDSIFNWKMINIAFWLWSQCTYQEGLWSQCFYQEETTPRPHPNQYGLCVSRLQDSVFNREMINVMFWKIWDPSAFIKKRLHQGLTPISMACVSPIFRTLPSIGRWSVLYSRRFGSTSHLPRRDYPKVSPQPVWIACLPASGLHLQSGDDQCYVLVCDPSALTKKRLHQGLTPTSMACVSPRFRTLSSIGRWSMLCSRRFGIPTASTKKRLPEGLTPSSMACVSPGFRTPSSIRRWSILHSGCDPSALIKKRLPEGLTSTSMACVSPGFRTPSSIGRWSVLCSRRFGSTSQSHLPRRDYPKASPQPVWLVCLPASGLHL